MKLFEMKNIFDRFSDKMPRILIWAVPLLLIIPNIALSITEPDYGIGARLANILLPAGLYLMLMSCWRRTGWLTIFTLPLMVLCAFQIVLLFLYGQGIIAIDMFLNVVTTNVHEATELLRNLSGAIVTVLVLYLPPLTAAIWMIVIKGEASRTERRPAIITGVALAVAGICALVGAYVAESRYSVDRRLFPVNVVSNICRATVRNAEAKAYDSTSADFLFSARSTRPAESPEVYVVVVGETARAGNWQLNGYHRPTNPRLSVREGLVNFPHAVSQSNTTHKSVPLMLSHLDANAFADSIYEIKGIISAFAEAGYATAYFSNQVRNGSLIDSFGEEADTCVFINDDGNLHFDGELLPLLAEFVGKDDAKKLVVLHTYGSHFNYRERYPADYNRFRPNDSASADAENRAGLVNSYDNSVLYIDAVLDSVAGTLAALHRPAAMIYAADHGEDIYDDSRKRFLHASPTPTYWQLHVPMFVWMSDGFRSLHPDKSMALRNHSHSQVSSSRCVFHTIMDMAGVDCPYFNEKASLASARYVPEEPLYLNDYNEAVPLRESGISSGDMAMFRLAGIRGAEGSVFAVVPQETPVGIEYLAFGHKTDVMPVCVHNR